VARCGIENWKLKIEKTESEQMTIAGALAAAIDLSIFNFQFSLPPSAARHP
jgi:hypothetical protein